MKTKIPIITLAIFLILLTSILAYSITNAQLTSANYNYGTNVNLNKLTSQEVCQRGQDFIVQISPLGCSPLVVTSDLLEEQNVPILCALSAIQVNPLIKVDAIKSMTFTGNLPKEVSGVGFHPAQAAVDTSGTTLLNSAVEDNIGYAVIVLKQQKNESAMPETVSGTLTANIKYDMQNTFGVGTTTYYLPELTNAEWESQFSQYGFWREKGFLRAESITDNSATISIYSGENKDTKLSSVTLSEGETSSTINLPGFYCLAGAKLKLDSLKNPNTYATLNINNEIIQVSQGEKLLDNKCSIPSGGIDKSGLTQTVTLRCSTDKKTETFTLKINPTIILEINGEKKEYKVGDFLYKEGDLGVYLGAINSQDGSTNLKKTHAILIGTPYINEDGLSKEELEKASSFEKLTRDSKFSVGVINNLADLTNAGLQNIFEIINYLDSGRKFAKISYDEQIVKGFGSGLNIQGKEIKLIGFANPSDIELDETIKTEYDLAMKDYRTLIDDYTTIKETLTNSSEQTILKQETFGQEAFINAIQLAYESDQKKTMIELCQELKSTFPDFKKTPTECNNDYKNSNQEKATKTIVINSETKSIIFEGISEPSLEKYSVTLEVKDSNGNTRTVTLKKDTTVYLNTKGTESLTLQDLEQNYAIVKIIYDENSLLGKAAQFVTSNNQRLTKSESFAIGGYTFTIKDIKLEKNAKVTILPNVDNTGTKANFTFNIGIEKRAIQLTTEEAEDRIEDLENFIEDWKEISDDLGNTIKTFNTACLGTGVFLTLKNLISNTDGKSIARNKVMRSNGGWVDICREKVINQNDGEDFDNINDCLLTYNDDIEADVEAVTNALQDVSVNQDNKEEVSQELANSLNNKIKNPDDSTKELDVTAVKTMLNYKGANNTISNSDLKELLTIQNALNDNTASDTVKSILLAEQYKLLTDINLNVETKVNEKSILKTITESTGLENTKALKNYGTKDSITATHTGVITTNIINTGSTTIPKNTHYEIFSYNGKVYLATLEKSTGNNYVVTGVYNRSGKDLDENYKKTYQKDIEAINRFQFKEYDSTAYENRYENPEIRYFETEPYKGMPALVPFDLTNGWYVAMKQTTSTSNIKTYQDSGAVSSFYLCNVGKDGKENFLSNTKDDTCQLYLTGTGQIVGTFGGLEKDDTAELVKCAIDAISDASKAYKSGVTRATISTKCANSITIDVGNPEVGVPEIQCQDFMSAQDCNLLFNVCDPVICPSSRCNLGGTYYVDDVIASGIIGSIALCLPNFQERIMVPICLTGLKAGIDNLLSLFQNYQDCLETQLETGESVGICDEIHSIYLCEFFWEQTLPLTEKLIPSILNSLFNNGNEARGGGEYLGVQSAWDTAQDSINYFSNYYGENIINAFKIKATQEIGGEICKNFISAKYPSGADVLDSLIEPDSPPQYTASFEETTFTTATIPPTSKYSVFYHIYAGQESNAYFRVYLQSPKGTSLYTINPTLTVAQGFIPAGEYSSDKSDFTATSGYQELCVSINGQEPECGFGKVTSSFAENYLNDLYIQEQISQTITTTAECVSGTPSAFSLLNLNLQDALSDISSTSIYELGITRICATINPGTNTDTNINSNSSKWQSVGTCDDGLICWLDTESVKDVIKSTDIEGEALGEIGNQYLKTILEDGDYLKDFASEITKINQMDDVTKTSYITDTLIAKAFYNYQKAKLHLIRGNAYWELAKLALSELEFPVNDLPPNEAQKSSSQYGDYLDYTTTATDANLNAIFSNCQETYTDGQCDFAKDVVKITREYKDTLADKNILNTITQDTTADCLEELILMIAMQESNVQHITSNGNIISGDDGISKGIMQINTDAHPDATNIENLEGNVRYGIKHLIENYNTESKVYSCTSKTYTGWKRALRYYNGWNTNCSAGNLNYVEEVIAKKSAIEKFGNVCDTTSKLETTIPEYPIFQYQDGTIRWNSYFTYNRGNWIWSTNKDNIKYGSDTISSNYRTLNTNADLSDFSDTSDILPVLNSLKTASYSEGIKILLDKVITTNTRTFSAELETNSITFSSERIFTITTKEGVQINLQNNGETEWRYTTSNTDWSTDLANSNYEIVKEIKEKTLYQGAQILFNLDKEKIYEKAFENIENSETLTNTEKQVIINAKSCKECGDGITNLCDEAECLAINKALGGQACEWNIIDDCIAYPDSIIIEFGDGSVTTSNIYYRYNNEWQWSYDEEKWHSASDLEATAYEGGTAQLTDTNKRFVYSLSTSSYEKGLQLFIDRTLANYEGITNAEIITEKVSFYKDEYEYPVLDITGNQDIFENDPSIFLRYKENNWEISGDKVIWGKANFYDDRLTTYGKKIMTNLNLENEGLYEGIIKTIQLVNTGTLTGTDTSNLESTKTWTIETAIEQVNDYI
ncbi:MAG: hypothetical protein OQK82_00540, partial [Candidatus Pacearchaeota archaeon]|nr:hypothetical protein [Candidatus Pacearchaeota archaeon]